ncbi:AMIN domain-containing protein [Leptolyngbya sp. FACHB-541]|uniref:AMIN domain-containing protein n=1 Tax=Leptolyngbya sp. FACHB-541 TaxID=2692810 RepID=UPI001683BBED|nr:AMIN domain-containing protein [Leptolyngbya sp. FACHB-541]MBD2001363.1 AMIN domain-containing protein [Leptolyngbya sp. FACHB-541]
MRKAKFVRVGFSLGLATLTAISNPLLRLSLIGIGAIAPFSAIAPAEAATLTNWQFDPNTRELRVTVPEGTTPRYFLLAEPPRIVLDLPNTQIGAVPEQQVFNGAVRQIRVGQFQPGLTRIVIELVADVEFAPGQVELRQEGDRWVLRPLLTDGAAAPDVATAPVQPAPVQPPQLEVEASDAETTEVIPETPAPEATAIAPSPAPQPETAAELGNDLPQLNPAPVVPDTSPNISDANSDVSEVIPETDSAVTSESETTADVVPEEQSAELLSADSPSANLPPLEPGALEIPVEPASEVPETLELMPPTNEPEPNAASVAEQVEPEESERNLPAEPPENLANPSDVVTEPTSQDAQDGEVSSEGDEAIALEAEEPINEAVSPTLELPSAASSPQTEIDQPEAQPSPAQSAEAEQNFAVPLQEEPEAREETVTLEPEAQTEEAIAPEPEMQAESELIALESDEQAPEAIAPAPQIPRALPPATFSTSPSVTVAVPPLSQAPSNPTVVEPPGNTPVAPSQSPPPAALPPATFSPNPTSQVSVPPVSTIPSPTAAAPTSPAPSEDEIEFGRPISRQPDSPPPSPTSTAIAPQDNSPENELPENDLPDQNVFSDQNVAVAPTSPNILLPSGTTLSLRYPGETSLPLESGVPRQEVLLLDQPVLDRNGNLIAEAGTQVIGRFETGSQGSQFIAQAIALQGQNVLLEAESATLAGDREVSEDSLLQNSALGALALTVLGGFTGIGLLGGLAAGATATYLTAPQPAIIQPNQIVEVRLTEDLPRP